MYNAPFAAPDARIQTPLDQAERAIQEKDYATLAKAAARLAKQVSDNRYLVEPLLVAVNHLAESPPHRALVVDLAKGACDFLPPDTGVRKLAVGTILGHLDALPEAAPRVDAAKLAAHHAPPNSDLKRQALTVWTEAVEALPTPTRIVRAAMDAAGYASAGSALEAQAVRMILKHLEALPEISQKIEAAQVAVAHAPDGSDHEQQVRARLDTLRRETDPLPLVPSPGASQRFVSMFTKV
ncbi:MAG: hypothetical protein WBK91_00555 [Alphaproteobacteria bacterium]